MNCRSAIFVSFFVLLAASAAPALQACTSMLVTRGASADGSVMITYTADSAGYYPILEVWPAIYHPEGAVIVIPATANRPANVIRQVPRTNHVIGVVRNQFINDPGEYWTKQGFINEHQLAITESTFTGRRELANPQGLINYPMLITLALQRASTAREAIDVMVELLEEYGYNSTGESISIADTEEAWVFEVIGTGPRPLTDSGQVVWVARKVPDGHISAHANMARIGEIPDVPCRDTFFYSDNIKSFAIENGFFDPEDGESFRFNYAYGAIDAFTKRVCETRTWSIFRRAAPSQYFSSDYHRGVPGAEPYPWSIVPDNKLTLADVFALKRCHYEGTEFDMTQGIDAGPHGLPLRWRPLVWTVEGDDNRYAWERPISTQQTGFSVVTQSRAWLPNMVGGVAWYGKDDTYTTCYFPLYAGITEVPPSFAAGSIDRFSWDSAWWIFNIVANYANLKFNRIVPDIKEVQHELESWFIAMQDPFEQSIVRTMESDPELARRHLTNYSVSQGEMVVARWQKLAIDLFTKFNDGYIRADEGHPYPSAGDPYPDEWLRRVLQERPTQFKLPQ